jgi:hypothetical protein
MISVKPKAAPPKHVVPIVPNWVRFPSNKTLNPTAPPPLVNAPTPPTPAKPIPGSVPFTQEYEAKYNKPPAGIPVEEDPNKGTGDTNFCKPDIISHCDAGTIWSEHIKCKFAIKASKHDRCTDYFEGFCKCLKAQIDSQGSPKTLTDCIGL